MRVMKLLPAICLMTAVTMHGQAKRQLAIEDYYRVLSVTNPEISPEEVASVALL